MARSFRLISGATGSPAQYNALHDDARGAASMLVHQQLGSYSLATNPTNGQAISFVVNGTTITLTGRTGAISAAGDFKIQGTAALTLPIILAQLQNPWTTNANQIALSLANQQLLQYVGFALSGTTLTAYSNNTTVNAQLTSYNGSTTFSSGSYTAQTMQMYVEPGVIYINGTQVKFAGGSTPTVTAPVSNPRIDILTINSSGTLAWTTGTENASPVVPAYPTYTKIVLCELYNVVGETALYDFANQQTGQGYIQYDSRSFPSIVTNFSAIAQDFLPDVTNTRALGSPSFQFANIYAQNIWSGSNPVAFAKFGGTGADGALSISSGTTTLSFGSANVLVKNYTSISITGTALLNFSNPNGSGSIAVLKSQGSVTVTTSATPGIDITSMGGGYGLISAVPGATSAGTSTNTDSSGSHIGMSNASPGMSAGLTIAGKCVNVFTGQNGGGGACTNDGGGCSPGSGGAGAGGLYIECAGALNFTAQINAQGQNGNAGSGSPTFSSIGYGGTGGSSQTAGGAIGPGAALTISNGGGTHTTGGGGGGGGVVVIIYATLVANTGTVNVSGGTGGAGTGGQVGFNGGNGYSLVLQNTDIT